MDADTPAANDRRSVGELVNAALTETDERAAWDAVGALHWRGTPEVLDRALSLCRSRCPQELRLGADILGQLGVPDRTFPKRCVEALAVMLETERDPTVLCSVLIAFSHLEAESAIEAISRFADHADPDVRHAVALALSGYDDPRALGRLIALSRDPVSNVRDWASFALGTQTDADSPELRDALADRLSDSDDDVREEAITGLANRRDRRAIEAIGRELAAAEPRTAAVAAAELLRAEELLPALLNLRGSGAVLPEILEDAIAACRHA